MVLAIDVYYYEDATAKSVGVLFNWEDEHPRKIIIENVKDVEEYIPGQFYKRELPCILAILNKVDTKQLEAIIVDGHIYVDNNKEYGLGGYLWKHLNGEIPVIGVAKKDFFANKETTFALVRGESKNPLYISSVGMEREKAIELIKNMKGKFRNPTILKELDQITKR
ncbi:endonuclease V [Apibacter sp. HY039]|uniref:endonuclease V n=1 Tax=Apibacter sp. HY039 TaxID=2501476 RepID=UPI000FEBDE0A|nr:endonuclease V [Apibacter sp. HY039]